MTTFLHKFVATKQTIKTSFHLRPDWWAIGAVNDKKTNTAYFINMKKSNLLAIAALGLGVMLSSCQTEGEASRQHMYNNASKVDNEGFTFLKTVHEKAGYELAYSEYAATNSGSAEIKALSDSIAGVYADLLPQLEELAAKLHVVLPDPGQLVFSGEELALDSEHVLTAEGYKHHFVHEQETIVDQFKRASRNTNANLRALANEQLPKAKSLYAQAGGVESHGAHH